MDKKSFMRGFGTGVLFAAVILGISCLMRTSDTAVIRKARQLGMTYADSDEKLFETATPAAKTTTPAAVTSAPSIVGPKVNATFTSGNYKYKVTKAATTAAKGTVKVVGLTKKGAKAKKLNVPATIKKQTAGYKVTAIGAKAFKGSKATAITLNKNIKTIPSAAFANCKKLKTLTVKAKLKKVAKKSFKGCKKKIKVKGASAKVRKANVKLLKKSGYKKFK